MVKESLRPCEFGGSPPGGGLCRIGPGSVASPAPSGDLRAEAPCNALPEALDPLGQRLRTPAERRIHRRFVSAHACSLDTTPLVRGFSARSVRKPVTASENLPMSTQMSARCFAQLSC